MDVKVNPVPVYGPVAQTALRNSENLEILGRRYYRRLDISVVLAYLSEVLLVFPSYRIFEQVRAVLVQERANFHHER